MFQTELIEKCKLNDRKAQLSLYRQYSEAMFYVAIRFLKNTQDAEDVMQEAFIRAFQQMHQFKGEVTFGAWLKRIVINKCIDFLKVRKNKTLSLDDGYMHITEEEDDWKVEAEITASEVKNAIEELPENYKYVVSLYLIEGYDHSEISEILQISVINSRTQLMRGKRKLKQLLTSARYGARS